MEINGLRIKDALHYDLSEIQANLRRINKQILRTIPGPQTQSQWETRKTHVLRG